MVQTKKTFREAMVKKNIGHVPGGSEFGAVIENNPASYPKTGQWRDQIPVIDKAKCTGCGICAKHCPENSIFMKKSGTGEKAAINYQFCKGCGICCEICPMGAISMKAKE